MKDLLVSNHACLRWLQRAMEVITEDDTKRPLVDVVAELGIDREMIVQAILDDVMPAYSCGSRCDRPNLSGQFTVKGKSTLWHCVRGDLIVSIVPDRVNPTARKYRTNAKVRKGNRGQVHSRTSQRRSHP